MGRERERHEIEVHVAAICFDLESGDFPRCLIARRAPHRELFPNLWECGGGQVRRGESFSEAASRQIREEFGLEVDILFPVGEYSIPTQDGVIPGIKFVATISGAQAVTLDPGEHTEYAWVEPEEEDLAHYDFIPGVDEDIVDAFVALAETNFDE